MNLSALRWRKVIGLSIAGLTIWMAGLFFGASLWFKASKREAASFDGRIDAPLRQTLAIMHERIVNETTYFGVRAMKSPCDHWVYQEIVYETRPDVIIEIGTAYGGGALGLAHFCDLLDHGRVIGVDIDLSHVAQVVRDHPRITLIESDACQAFAQVRELIEPGEHVMVIEDSSHTYENTLAVLRTYSPLVAVGCYFVVEDSIFNHGIHEGGFKGPYEAVESFLAQTDDFTSDRSREAFGITWNPTGYLKRVRRPE